MQIRTAAQQVIEARYGKPVDELILELSAKGLTQAQIAAEFGVSRMTLIRWMQRLGLSTRPKIERAA